MAVWRQSPSSHRPQQHPGPRGQSMSTRTGSRKPGNTYGTAPSGPALSCRPRLGPATTPLPLPGPSTHRGASSNAAGEHLPPRAPHTAAPVHQRGPNERPCCPFCDVAPDRGSRVMLRQALTPSAGAHRRPRTAHSPLLVSVASDPEPSRPPEALRCNACHTISQPEAMKLNEQQHQDALRRPRPGAPRLHSLKPLPTGRARDGHGASGPLWGRQRPRRVQCTVNALSLRRQLKHHSESLGCTASA
ncbi:Hypothetical protein GLP15_174 [Giardia lamblia P15]|uniref:Uncharacterized protein n=1 Tax=Giardia intestinalis (strain P15) TaxID=658858 RepID=E1EY40_GIAIA|nr:Hypothetical protein GLP15_174 [Giardia lamblia P15]